MCGGGCASFKVILSLTMQQNNSVPSDDVVINFLVRKQQSGAGILKQLENGRLKETYCKFSEKCSQNKKSLEAVFSKIIQTTRNGTLLLMPSRSACSTQTECVHFGGAVPNQFVSRFRHRKNVYLCLDAGVEYETVPQPGEISGRQQPVVRRS